jgi:hypothetical protein
VRQFLVQALEAFDQILYLSILQDPRFFPRVQLFLELAAEFGELFAISRSIWSSRAGI